MLSMSWVILFSLKLKRLARTLEKGKPLDMYMPVGGEVLEFNESLTTNPEILNQDPYEKGWVIKIKMTDPSEISDLLDAAGYASHIGV
jgi:glycine cleavage system H protein